MLFLQSITILSVEAKRLIAKLFSGTSEEFTGIQGQIVAKRALEIAAAGGHNIFMLWYNIHLLANIEPAAYAQ